MEEQHSATLTLIAFAVAWLACGITCAYIAHAKNRDALTWLLIGSLGGVLALVAIAAVPRQETSTPPFYLAVDPRLWAALAALIALGVFFLSQIR
jgi:Zn-dependent protease with chaperone function